MAPLTKVHDITDCFELDEKGQNAAIFLILEEQKAQREIDRETVAELKRIGAAVEALTMNDIVQGVRWSFLDKIGALVLGLVFSIIGGLTVWFLQGRGGP